MGDLSIDELDGISEAFNIGVGMAAASLSQMVGQEVALNVPQIALLERERIIEDMRHSGVDRVTGVREQFGGPFAGHALLVFPESRGLELVRLLLRQEVDLDFLTDLEQEALVEVGNIILNACIASLASIMGEEIVNEVPAPVKGEIGEILSVPKMTDSNTDCLIRLHIEFSVKQVDIQGHIIFLMEITHLETFRQKIRAYFGFAET
jgi:chemotaxis protein CheC